MASSDQAHAGVRRSRSLDRTDGSAMSNHHDIPSRATRPPLIRAISSYQTSEDSGISVSGPSRPGVLFSPSDKGQHFALSLADGSDDPRADEDGPFSLSRRAVRRFRLDTPHLDMALADLDLSLFHCLTPHQPPALISIYISAKGIHKIAQAQGDLQHVTLPPPLVAALILHVAPHGTEATEIHDLPAFARHNNLALPIDFPAQYFAGSAIALPPSDSAPDVSVGLVAVFDRSSQQATQNKVMAQKIGKLARLFLRQSFTEQRRNKELLAQAEIVKLTRMSHGLSASGASAPTPVFDESGRASFHLACSKVFSRAATGTRKVLAADAAVVLDVSGFKFEEKPTAKGQRSGTLHIPGYGSEEHPVTSTQKPAADDLSVLSSSPSSSDSSDIASLASPRLTAPAVASCLYTESDKPVPVLAASGSDKHHFAGLSGQSTRAAIAKYLVSVKACGAKEHASFHGETEPGHSDSDQVSASPLERLLPPGYQGLLVTPVFDPFQHPAYLLLVAFRQPPPVFERSDRAFLEQVGAALMSAALRTKSRAIDRAQMKLTRRMQHTLRTPLHNIIGSCEAAYSDLDLSGSDDTKRVIANVALSAESLGASISDLFDYVTMAGVREPAVISADAWPETDLRGLFEAVSRTANSAWRLHCLSMASLEDSREQVPPPPELNVTCGPGSWELMPEGKFSFDIEGLARVVSKACNNALQATQHGIVLVNLSVGSADNSTASQRDQEGKGPAVDELVLKVSDTGKGMSKDFIDNHLFRSFDQALEDSAQHRMSLAICSSIMSRLGGRIKATSIEGQGSTIEFVFPYCGPAGNPATPFDLSVAAMPPLDSEPCRQGFLAFCDSFCSQFSACFLGDAGESPQLLDQAQVLLVAGERCRSEKDRAGCCEHIVSRQTRNGNQLVIELPNRAFFDHPASLKPARKHKWIGTVPALEIYRPLVLPDLITVNEVFGEVKAGRQIFDTAFLSQASSSSNSQAVPPAQADSSRIGARSNSGATQSSTESSQSDSRQRTFTAMIVEDEPINARILARLLQKCDIQYVQASNGKEAIEQFRQHWPQVILLDINMPILNGFEAAVEIRKIEQTRGPYRTRIIAVTALSLETDKIKGKQCGIDDWMTKPVRMAQLTQDVKAWKEEAMCHTEPTLQQEINPPCPQELAVHTINEPGGLPASDQ